MNKLRKFLLTTTLGLLSLSAYARIGETMDEAIKRYGPVTHEIDMGSRHWYCFRFKGFVVNAVFNDGKIVEIEYLRDPANMPRLEAVSTFTELSENEIINFLKANSTEEWQTVGIHEYQTSDLKAYYSYMTAIPNPMHWYYHVIIMTNGQLQYINDEKKQKEDKAQAGF